MKGLGRAKNLLQHNILDLSPRIPTPDDAFTVDGRKHAHMHTHTHTHTHTHARVHTHMLAAILSRLNVKYQGFDHGILINDLELIFETYLNLKSKIQNIENDDSSNLEHYFF